MPETSLPAPCLQVTTLALARNSAPPGAPNLLGPLSFTLPHAGCWWLAGVSGAGKSLLMESLAGFHVGAQGSICVNSKEISDCAPERRSISLMPQRWRLFPHWTVARNLRFAARLGGAANNRRNDRIDRLARRLQVADLLRRPVHALSGGETQRIALIQTLLAPSQVLLLDEPLSAVDAALQSAVLDLLLEESAENQRICLIATHLPFLSCPMQGALNMEKGQLIQAT
jgi:ABC-type sugar transport system ATPase subunit